MLPISLGGNILVDGVNILLVDVIALIYFTVAWYGYSSFAEAQYKRMPNLMYIMDQMRVKWMRQVLKRDMRMPDSTLVGNLLRSISFFANTSIFILIGLFTVLGYRDSAIAMLNELPYAVHSTAFMWELKIFVLAIIFVYAFFKFTWSLRQYNYCCILLGAAPLPKEAPETHEDYAQKAGKLIANAGKHFNMGLRGYYFGLATITWFLHPLLFIATTTFIIYITYRREFRSETLMSRIKDGAGKPCRIFRESGRGAGELMVTAREWRMTSG